MATIELNGADEPTVGPIREALKAAEKARALRFNSGDDAPASAELPTLEGSGGKLLAVTEEEDGIEFVDPPEGGGGGGGAESFTDLDDVPGAYSGQGGKLVAVKGDASGLEFIDPPEGGGGGGGGGAETFLELTDAPSSYSGQNGKFLRVNSGATALEFVEEPGGGGGSAALSDPDTWGELTLDATHSYFEGGSASLTLKRWFAPPSPPAGIAALATALDCDLADLAIFVATADFTTAAESTLSPPEEDNVLVAVPIWDRAADVDEGSMCLVALTDWGDAYEQLASKGGDKRQWQPAGAWVPDDSGTFAGGAPKKLDVPIGQSLDGALAIESSVVVWDVGRFPVAHLLMNGAAELVVKNLHRGVFHLQVQQDLTGSRVLTLDENWPRTGTPDTGANEITLYRVVNAHGEFPVVEIITGFATPPP